MTWRVPEPGDLCRFMDKGPTFMLVARTGLKQQVYEGAGMYKVARFSRTYLCLDVQSLDRRHGQLMVARTYFDDQVCWIESSHEK